MRTEELILRNLVHNEQYTRKVIPFLKPDYFHDNVDRKVYELIDSYIQKYNISPTTDALLIDLGNASGLSADQFTSAENLISSLDKGSDENIDWLVDTSESFCQDKALYNGIMTSIKIMDDKTNNLSKGSIPQILSDALGVSFDTHIGHDFIDNASDRYDFYHSEVDRIPFHLKYLNIITNGGLPNKTLTCFLASTGVGKSLLMCDLAANNLLAGYNVLYITLEMSEEKIAERVDANILDISIQNLQDMEKDVYLKRIEKLKNKTTGKFIIKEYPTAGASTANFRHLLNELKIKKNFVPQIIYIDYLNICASSRIKNSNANSYTIVKSIAEEVRGLAIEFDVPIVTATQTTRNGAGNSDMDITDTSESWGLPQTVDALFGMISSEELEDLGQLMIKQLKNRYNDVNYYKRFIIGIDKAKMKLYDVEDDAQDNITDSGNKGNVDKFKSFK